MRFRVRCLLLSGLALLSGCAEYRPAWLGKPSPSSPAHDYSRADLDELLSFGADMAKKPGSARAEECRSLVKLQRGAPGAGVKLHLMTGRLLSDACGDARKIADAAEGIPTGNLDTRLRWWVAIQTETLKRLGGGSKRAALPDRKQKAAKDAPDAKPDAAKPEASDEAKVLRKKLEEIRSIERKLDETNGPP